MSSALPPRKALTPFLYTSHPSMRVNVIPQGASDGYKRDPVTGALIPPKRFEVGHLVSLVGAAKKTGSIYQGAGQATVITGDLHDPNYADVKALKLLGVAIDEYPLNRPSMQDEFGELRVENFSLAPDTRIAGSYERLAINVSQSIVLVKLWDTVNDQPEVLNETHVGMPVFASKTGTDAGAVAHTGAAGYGSITAGQETIAGIVQIGTVYAVPIVGDHRAYVLFEPSLARRVI